MSASNIVPNSFQAEMILAVLEGRMPLAVRAGVGVGKTAGVALLLLVMSEVVPDAEVLVVMKSQRSIKRNLNPTCKRLFAGKARWSARDFTWTFKTGFKVELAYYNRTEGSDEAENPIEGADVWLVIIDEAQQLPESVFEHATDRARKKVYDINGTLRSAGVVAMGRPSARGWHRRLVREAVEKLGGDPDAHVLSASTTVNAHNLDPDYLARQKAIRTPEQYRAMIECAEMPPEEGQVFGALSMAPWPEGNQLEDFSFEQRCPTWLSVDFGANTPHVLYIQEVRRGDLLLDCVFAELAPSKVLTPELAVMLTTGADVGPGARVRVWPRDHRELGDALPLDGVVGDPAGHQKSRQTGLSDIDVLRREPTEDWMPGLGVPVLAPTAAEQRSTRERATAIQSMICAADGHRRLVFAPGVLVNPLAGRALFWALQSYTWQDILRAETRRKRYADLVGAVDALGYYVAERRRRPVAEQADAAVDALFETPAARATPRWKRRRR